MSTATRHSIARAITTGAAIALAQLAGAANDGAPSRCGSRERSVIDDREGVLYLPRSRALTSRAILAELDGMCGAVAPRGDSCVIVYATDALRPALAATGTHGGSPAARAAVKIVAASLRAFGVDVIG